MIEDQKLKAVENKSGRRFNGYGPYVGTIFGLFFGLFISGPNFHIWTYSQIFGVVIGFAVVGGFVGLCIENMASSYTSSVYGDTDALSGGDFGDSSPFDRFEASDHSSHHAVDSVGDFGGGHDG